MQSMPISDDYSLDTLRRGAAQAQKAILAAAAADPEKWWNPRELRAVACTGQIGTVMSYALTDLVNQGQLELDPRLRVRLRAPDGSR